MYNKLIKVSSFAALLCVFTLTANAQKKPTYKYLFQNPDLSVDALANDLISHLTLDQKIAQMCNGAPGIDSLGIQPYNWWNEDLHGICRSGIARVFSTAGYKPNNCQYHTGIIAKN